MAYTVVVLHKTKVPGFNTSAGWAPFCVQFTTLIGEKLSKLKIMGPGLEVC